MEESVFIRYDETFIRRYKELGTLIEEGDKAKLHRFLIENFDCVFKLNQVYWKLAAGGYEQAFTQVGEDVRRELTRPLSHRQYRLVEQAFSAREEEDIISSVWDFLNDCDRIYEKKVMSAAEVNCFSLILEEVYCCLVRGLTKEEQAARFAHPQEE